MGVTHFSFGSQALPITMFLNRKGGVLEGTCSQAIRFGGGSRAST